MTFSLSIYDLHSIPLCDPKLITISLFSILTDECYKEFSTFDDFFEHLEKKHPNNTNYQCIDCKISVSPNQIESHLNLHSFYEYECIYCKSGDNDILKLRKHLSAIHPSKFSFVATRRRLTGVEPIADFSILYIGDLSDQNSYKLINLPSGSDLSCMDPSLHAYENHRLQQNVKVKKIVFTKPMPQLTFCGTPSDFFHKYNLPFLCTANVSESGIACSFRSNKEDDLLRHISKKHSEKQITYKNIQSVSQSEKVTTLVVCEFECNMCQKLFKMHKEILEHFRRVHSTHVFDSKIIQNIEIIESTDPMQPIQSKKTVSNRLQFGGLFVYPTDVKYTNTKSQIIAHHRRNYLPTNYLEFQIKTIIHDPSFFGWSTGGLTQENQKFDRMMVYECFHCCDELTSTHMLFESIEEVEAHCRKTHATKEVLWTPKKLFACAECLTISTIDGIKKHHRHNHSNKPFAIVSPTSRNHCGVCNLFVGVQGKKILIEHFQSEHQTGDVEQFDDRLLRKLQLVSGDKNISDAINAAQFSPECCRNNRFTSVQQLVKHLYQCSNDDVKVKFQQGDVKEIMKRTYETNIFFPNGSTVAFKTIGKSKIGQEIKNRLIDTVVKG